MLSKQQLRKAAPKVPEKKVNEIVYWQVIKLIAEEIEARHHKKTP